MLTAINCFVCKAWAFGRALAGIVGSNPTEGMEWVSVVGCQVEVSATEWSLVQRSSTECGVSKWVWSWNLKRKRGGLSPLGLLSRKQTKRQTNKQTDKQTKNFVKKHSSWEVIEKLPHLLEAECSLPCSQEPDNCTSTESDAPNLLHLFFYFKNILSYEICTLLGYYAA
jgi:hypothetical protein